MSARADLVGYLITSQALRIAPAGDVFWYTSGTVGPYYINTHYLFGGPEEAEELLRFIDDEKDRIDTFVPELRERCHSMYDSDTVYRTVVDALVERVRPKLPNASLVSGGERRDWFFSVVVAEQLDLPHLYIYKDGCTFLHEGVEVSPISQLADRRAVHIADLVTEASSYAKNWVPTMERLGGRLVCAVNVVDRAQGGVDVLMSLGVEAESLLRVDEKLFAALRKRDLIDSEQEKALSAYCRDPKESMRHFLTEHEHFVDDALNGADARTAARARLLVDQNLYGLHSS